MGIYKFKKIFLSGLLAVFLFSPAFSSNSYAAYEELRPVDDGRLYACLLVNEFGIKFSFLINNRKIAKGLDIIPFNKAQKRIKSKMQKLYLRINDFGISKKQRRKLKKKRKLLKRSLNDIRDCRVMRGGFNYDEPALSSSNQNEPFAEPACKIVDSLNKNETNQLAFRRSYEQQLGDQPAFARIINGNSCEVEDSPVVMLDLYDHLDRLVSHCSGTVIDEHFILTAAHCLINISRVEVYTRNNVYFSQSLYPHNQFAYTADHDVALVKTTEKIDLTPAKLVQHNDLQIGERVVFAGYGTDETYKTGRLKAANNVIHQVSDAKISILYTGGSYGNTCFGDSGGPVLVERNNEWLIAGVTSNGRLADCGIGDLSNFASVFDPMNQDFFQQILNS